MKRAISKEFMEALLHGELAPVLELVKKDDSLDLEMRGKKIIIYYQGLKLFSITEESNEKYKYGGMDKKYRRRKDGTEIDLPILSIDNIGDYIIKGKNVIDTYDMKSHFEYEVKQMIVKENNRATTAKGTDFYVIDTEYKNDDNAQFDIVALHIKSDSLTRKKAIASIAIIEIKQGENSLKTTQKNPGIHRHLEDFQKHISDNEKIKSFISDMKEILQKKYELGLIEGLSQPTVNKLSIRDEIEFYIVLSDFKKASSLLQEELKTIDDECKFFTSSFMGYGLYDWTIKTKEEILEMTNR